MATTYHTLDGLSKFCKPYDFQIDREFEDPDNGKGGNWATTIILDDDNLQKFRALGTKAKPKGNEVTLRRYEHSPFQQNMGPPTVTLPEGVKEKALIGNGSEITVGFEVYDYTFKGKPGKAIRLVEVIVKKLVEYVPPVKPVADADGPPVH